MQTVAPSSIKACDQAPGLLGPPDAIGARGEGTRISASCRIELQMEVKDGAMQMIECSASVKIVHAK